MSTIGQHKQALTEAHLALWKDLPGGLDGRVLFLERVGKFLAAELVSQTFGDGVAAARLLNEGIVAIAESEIAFLANEPEIKVLLKLIKELRQ